MWSEIINERLIKKISLPEQQLNFLMDKKFKDLPTSALGYIFQLAFPAIL